MKVSELVALLQTYPQTAEVTLGTRDGFASMKAEAVHIMDPIEVDVEDIDRELPVVIEADLALWKSFKAA